MPRRDGAVLAWVAWGAASADHGVLGMLIGFHFIVTAYGFWLPNDPRGSWSTVIRQWELLRHGPPTKVDTRRSVADVHHDGHQRLAAKQSLKYPPVHLSGQQALAVAKGIAAALDDVDYRIHAMAVLPEHFHLVMAYHPREVKQIAAHLKAKATMAMHAAGLHPMAKFPKPDGSLPSPWARNHWCVFIGNEDHMRQAIQYVERDPLKEGKRVQRWWFLEPYQTRLSRGAKCAPRCDVRPSPIWSRHSAASHRLP